MSLDTVVEDIRADAEREAEEIRAEAEERAEEIRAEAKERAAEIRAEAEEEVEEEIARERDQARSTATLEAKQARLAARRDVLEEVRADTESAVAAIEGDRREELTRALLADAAEEFPEDADVSVSGRAEDEDLVCELLSEYEGFSWGGEYDCLGGVVVEAEGSRVRVTNTFDAALDQVWEDSLKDVSDRLFGDDTAAETGSDG